MAGSIGPSGMLPSSDDPALSGVSFAGLSETFREQAAALVEGGADLILIETQQDILETRAAIDGARAAFRELGRWVPLQVQVALDVTGRMLLGTDVGAVLAILHGMRADVIGVNCSVGPEHLREPVRFLCQHAPGPVSVIPNAGLPRNVDGVASYPLGPDDMARELAAVRLRAGRARWSAAAAAARPSTSWRCVEAVAGGARAPRQVVVRAVARERDHGLGARAAAQAAPDRRAGEHPGQPRVQAGDARRRLRRGARRSPATRSRAARTCSTCAWR